MKKIISFLLAILTLLSMLLCNLSVSATCIENPYSQFIDDPYYEVTHDYINGIVSKLSNLPASGSVCIDYLGEEILLHRAILFATHNIESYSSNPELTDISDDIIDNYTGELKEMRIEAIALLQASHDISALDNKCAKSELVKEISKNETTNTQAYISRLKTLQSALK